MKRLGFALLALFLLAPLLATAVIISLGSQEAESCSGATAGVDGVHGVETDTHVEAALQGDAARSLDASQRTVVARIIAEGRRRQVPPKAVVAALTVAGAESGTGAPWTDPEQPASSATAATAAREHAATRLDDRGHTRM